MAHSFSLVARTAVLAGVIGLAPGAGLQAQMPHDDLRTLADQGNAAAQYNLGVRHLNGTLSLSDLEDVEWVLDEFDAGAPPPAEPVITLMVDRGRIIGHAGCNRYFADAMPGETPGTLQVEPAGVTRMACPAPIGDLEVRFLQALDAVTGYAF